jgi:hypothetical protein
MQRTRLRRAAELVVRRRRPYSMSSSTFYRSAMERDLSPEVRRLMLSLLARAERIDALAESLPAKHLANRARREGKPVVLSKSAKRTIRSFEQDSRLAAAELPALVAGLRSELALVRAALGNERTALSMEQALFSVGHPEDVALSRPLLEMIAENIAELEAFLSG